MPNGRKSIPDVPFCKPAAHHGLDMLELAKLTAIGKTLTPRIDQPHRIKFNLLMLVEEGRGAPQQAIAFAKINLGLTVYHFHHCIYYLNRLMKKSHQQVV